MSDFEFTGMVNANSVRRQQMQAAKKRQKADRAEAEKQCHAQARKALQEMLLEAGSCAAVAVGVLLVMGQGLVDPTVGVPAALVFLVATCIRVDRYLRR